MRIIFTSRRTFFWPGNEPSDRTYARARVDRNFAFHWEQHDDDPQRSVYIEAVFMHCTAASALSIRRLRTVSS